MESRTIFLNAIKARIEAAEFDEHFTLPFMNRKLMFDVIKGKTRAREEAGKTPMLSESEIKKVLIEMRESSGSTFALFVNHGILEKTEDGLYQLSKKGKLALIQNLSI